MSETKRGKIKARGDNEATREPEAKKESRLSNLDLAELIPKELADHPKVVGDIEVLSSVNDSDDEVQYVIIDDKTMSMRKIEDEYHYFSEEETGNFPEWKKGDKEYARPLVHGQFEELTPDIIFVGMIEVSPELRGTGIGVAFRENFTRIIKDLGYRFITGYQDDAEVSRFVLNRGAYLLEEIREDKLAEFARLRDREVPESVYFTVGFLNPEDVEKYIKPERIGTSVDDKLELKAKHLGLYRVYHMLTKTIEAVERQDEDADVDTAKEIMEDLNEILPADQRTTVLDLLDEVNPALVLKAALEHLKSKMVLLVEEATLKQIEENIV